MQTTIQAIALRTVKYNDRNSILTAWSGEHGMVSLLMPSSSGGESRRRRALTQPLALFECVADMRPGRDVHHARDLRPLVAFGSIHTNGMKATIAFFLAEVLAKVLQGGADPNIWRFITQSLVEFDRAGARDAANFHLYLLARLTSFLGFGADSSGYEDGRVFDFATGCFVPEAPTKGRYLTGRETRLARIIIDSEWSRLRLIGLNHTTRAAILEALTDYYAAHDMTLTPLRTLDVIRGL